MSTSRWLNIYVQLFFVVKAWGKPTDKPILLTHGRSDNAGSFDLLIPHLPKTFYYICIDLPSHGRSSHLPRYIPIHTIDYVMVYKLVLEYFKRKTYILLGHSYGAGIGQYFARFYPEYVEKIINIDCVVFHYIKPEMFKSVCTKIYDDLINITYKEKTGKQPSYTEADIIDKLRRGRLNEPLSIEAARCLAQRMVEPAGENISFHSLY